jgi:acyl-CoA synthetase (NDP forming)
VPLAALAPATHAAIDAQKMFSRIGNPLDLGIFGGMRRAGEVPSHLLGDPAVGVGLALVHSMNPWQGDPIRAALARARETSGKPLLIVAPGGMPEAERASYETRGMPVFTDTDILLEGVGALLAAAATPAPAPAQPPARSFDLPRRPLTEPESLRLLGEFGVPVVATAECASLAEAEAAAARCGYPVVLKGVVEGVAHKSDAGLVHARLPDEAALRAAYATLGCPRAIVQPMVSGALETIAGVSRAEGVGLVLVAGLGGIHAEALRDVTLWPLPVARDAIEQRLRHTALGRVLASPRWRHPAAFGAFVDLLLALQDAALTLDDRLAAIDVNPVILGAHGAIAVDALLVPRT